MPSEELLAAMGSYNEELVKAGIMARRRWPETQFARRTCAFLGQRPRRHERPFAETKELFAVFWMWKVSRWRKR